MPTSATGNSALDDGDGDGLTPVRRSAEHGFTPMRRSAEHGFTLVELMVVITIVGLVAAVALWAMPDPRGRVTDEAARFALRVRGAHDAAIVEARPVSLWITRGGYGFDRRLAGNWVPIAEKPLRVTSWAEGTHAAIGDTGAASGGRVRVTFDETGFADRPAAVTLTRSGARADVAIDSDGNVRVVG